MVDVVGRCKNYCLLTLGGVTRTLRTMPKKYVKVWRYTSETIRAAEMRVGYDAETLGLRWEPIVAPLAPEKSTIALLAGSLRLATIRCWGPVMGPGGDLTPLAVVRMEPAVQYGVLGTDAYFPVYDMLVRSFFFNTGERVAAFNGLRDHAERHAVAWLRAARLCVEGHEHRPE